MNTELLNEINSLSLEVFKIYNRVIRTPLNWKDERERLEKNPNNRANFQYEEVNLKGLKKVLLLSKNQFLKESKETKTTGYFEFLNDVVLASVNNALMKIKIIGSLNKCPLKSLLKLRQDFYSLPFDYKRVECQFEKIKNDRNMVNIGKVLGKQQLSAEEAAEIIRKSLNKAVTKIDKVIKMPKQFKSDILKTFTAQVEVVDDPSFSMRCIVDPKTSMTKILLNKRRKYSRELLKIAFLHEFCGHALEMTIFDGVFIKKGILPKIFGYTGVSSPNIFDVKSEVFADLIVKPFLTKAEIPFVKFRREVWLICRAMADYLYNIKGKTIADVMKIYETVGLSDFAFDEAIMAAIFVDGYQGMYLFANEEIEKLAKGKPFGKEFLTKLLLIGKIPYRNLNGFSFSIVK